MGLKLPTFRLFKARVARDTEQPDRLYREGEIVAWLEDRDAPPLPDWLERAPD